MPLFTPMKCPECGKMAVFPRTKMMEIDGQMCGPMTVKCSECGWEPSDEEVKKQWREEYRGPESDS